MEILSSKKHDYAQGKLRKDVFGNAKLSFKLLSSSIYELRIFYHADLLWHRMKSYYNLGRRIITIPVEDQIHRNFMDVVFSHTCYNSTSYFFNLSFNFMLSIAICL